MLLFLVYCLAIIPSTVNAANHFEKITLQLPWKYQFEFAGYIAAKEMGFYKEARLKVELKELSDSQHNVISDVLNGHADYGVYDNDIIQSAVHTKQPVVLLANYFKRSALVLISNEPVFNPDKLVDKKIMATQAQINSGAINLLFKKFNVDPQSLTIIPHSFNIDDFINGKIDISTAYLSNELYKLQKDNVPYR
ncbi:MAG: ABC transporter substrate-binding protein [gamma proteobacterium symbiont of Bathyaustriella thionipta]|nr:ABC transporter substrate-binding protein [gamma proteobacterium symbiont of Bathyaustriella thionipta]MCU7950865.1 ABC transporter substrate-binding protein [gamma proteobacterium symbiont of Bathyaustriella thionipta]MCU7951823.1 ABC transporter substrate-binding protein [gamma proteobacterium symbiont of Bathyaustriella thionipta]MCU7957370.1 ABC transporter substrate-binding protein [gamma proteobacterium symbiont of Bathyaustriella thionipta]MCU7967294.1 ABC transporter substrate-bindin